MEWKRKTVLQFISLIRDKPEIWDVHSPEYRNKQMRRDSAREIALLMKTGITMNEVLVKWTNLRTQYIREKRKRADENLDCYETHWFAYQAMDDLLTSSPYSTSLNGTGVEDDTLLNLLNQPPKPPSFISTPLSPVRNATPLSCSSSGPQLQSERVEKNVLNEAVETMTAKSENEYTSNTSQQSTDDVLTSFGVYVVAHLRKYPPRLQSKARFEINKMLYEFDMQNLLD